MSAMEVIVSEPIGRGSTPVWDNGRGRLIWADAEKNLVFQLMPSTRAKATISGSLAVSSIVLHKSRSIVYAGPNGLYLSDGQGSTRVLVNEDKEGKLSVREAIADTRGRIYAATGYWGPAGMQKPGKLHVIGGREPRVVDEGLQLVGGMTWSPDDRVLYVSEAVTRRILAYDADSKTGELKNKRTFVQVPKTEGVPMGLTTDADAGVWCAHWFTGEVVRYNMDGEVSKRLPVPNKHVSGVGFGGDTLKDLYVTASTSALPAPDLAPPGYDPTPDGGASLFRQKITFTQGRPVNLTAVL